MLLQAQASRDGRRLSPRYLYTHARSLPHLLIPPLIVNTAVGFTLFETYTYTEARLLSRSSPRPSPGPSPTPLWIVATAGGAAGLAQSLLSAPLDNVRYVLQRGDPLRWHTVLVAIRAPFSPTAHFQPRFFTAALALSLARDAIGFAAFFSLFELSRRAAAHVNAEKSTTSRLAAVSTLLAGGALGAMAYEAAGKPFDRMRSTIWNARERAPNAPTSPYSILKSHANKKRSAFAYTYFVAPFTRRKTLNPQPWATRTLRRVSKPPSLAHHSDMPHTH